MSDSLPSSITLDPEHHVQSSHTSHQHLPNTSVTDQVRKLYIFRAETMKNSIDTHAAEVQQRQDKMRLINEVICEINHLTDANNSVEMKESAKLLENIEILKELGVKLKENQTTFCAIERDRLIENLHLAADNWDKENRHQTQKMEIIIKELDRLLMILKDVDKKEDQAKRPIIAGMKGG